MGPIGVHHICGGGQLRRFGGLTRYTTNVILIIRTITIQNGELGTMAQ